MRTLYYSLNILPGIAAIGILCLCGGVFRMLLSLALLAFTSTGLLLVWFPSPLMVFQAIGVLLVGLPLVAAFVFLPGCILGRSPHSCRLVASLHALLFGTIAFGSAILISIVAPALLEYPVLLSFLSLACGLVATAAPTDAILRDTWP
jgi:hypothetical protein